MKLFAKNTNSNCEAEMLEKNQPNQTQTETNVFSIKYEMRTCCGFQFHF